MRPSVEALPGDSNAAVTVVSTDAANENMSNQEMDMTESLFSERDMRVHGQTSRINHADTVI